MGKHPEPANVRLDGFKLHNSALFNWLFIGIFIWLVSYGYYYVFGVFGVKPLYSYILLVCYAAFLLLASQAIKGGVSMPLGRHIKPLAVWSVIYIIYLILQALRMSLVDESIQALVGNIEMIVLLWCAAYLMAMFPKADSILLVTAGVAVFSVTWNLWDFINPVFSSVPGRSAGLYENPNISGQMIAMLMIAGVTAVPRRLRLLFVLFCGLGVLLTFSRGAWLVWGTGVFLWLARGQWKAGYKLVANGLFAVVLGLGSIWALFSGTLGEIVADTPVEQYLTSNTAARLGIGALVVSGDAAEEREELVDQSLKEWADAPLIGHGLGYTSVWQMSQRPHNMYLMFLVEGGIVGLIIYLSMLGMLWWGSVDNGRILALQLVISSLFTHNNLEQPAVIMMMALIITYGALSQRGATNNLHFVFR